MKEEKEKLIAKINELLDKRRNELLSRVDNFTTEKNKEIINNRQVNNLYLRIN
jgi:hypothetical protein